MVKEAIEGLYDGLCTVYNTVDYTDGSITRQQEEAVYENIPCHISYKSLISGVYGNAVTKDCNNKIEQIIKLFISPDYIIKPGSKINVSQYGVSTVYKNSGQPAVFPTHQELILDLYKEWC